MRDVARDAGQGRKRQALGQRETLSRSLKIGFGVDWGLMSTF